MNIQFETTPPYKKGTIIHFGDFEKVIVTKVHKNGLWKRILKGLGYKPLINCIETKAI